MTRYAIERDPSGFACRLWWVEEEALCACGEPRAPHCSECLTCRRKRIGFFFRGRNPECRWCGGERGCLMCGSQ
jgi:hypothetical protein